MKEGKSSELDKVLIVWFKLCVSEDIKLSGDLVKEQAKFFHEELGIDYKCDYSEGCLQHFKQQCDLKFHAVCGEKCSADKEAAAAFVGQNVCANQTTSDPANSLIWHSTGPNDAQLVMVNL